MYIYIPNTNSVYYPCHPRIICGAYCSGIPLTRISLGQLAKNTPYRGKKSVFTGYRCKIYNLAHRWPRKSTLDLHRGISLEGRYIPKRLPDSLIALLRLRVVPLVGTNQGPTRDPHKRGCELCARLQTMVCIHFV